MSQTASEKALGAYEAGRLDDAEALALAALVNEPGEPDASRVIAMIRLGQGNVNEAIEYLKPAREVAPDDARLANLLGAAYMQRGSTHGAFKYFKMATELDPGNPAPWQNLGSAAVNLQRWSDASAAYAECLNLESGNVEALHGLASIALVDDDPALALKTAQLVTARHPNHLKSRSVIAEALYRLDRYEEALEEAKFVAAHQNASDQIKGAVLGIAADARDALGRYDEAFETYLQAKDKFIKTEWRELQRLDDQNHFETLAGIADVVPTLARNAKTFPEFEKGPQYLLFVGFPKSGMTVMNKVLMRYPQIVDIDSAPPPQKWVEVLWSEQAGENLTNLTYEDLVSLRAGAIESIENTGLSLPEGSLAYQFVPFYSQYLAGVALVQPNIKVIFMHRDPRDVVLSCFKQRFQPWRARYEYLRLETAARFYDLTMGVVDAVRENFDIDIIELRFDDVMDDLEGEARRVIEFLGLEWRDDLFLDEDRIVNRELQDGRRVRGWRNYESHLAPVRATLDKWAKRFGYD